MGQAEHRAAWTLLAQVNKRDPSVRAFARANAPPVGSPTIVDAALAACMREERAHTVIAIDPEFERLGFAVLPGA